MAADKAAAKVMQKKIDEMDLGYSKITGKKYQMGGHKPFNPKTMYNPVEDVLKDDLKDPFKTLPDKLIAIEDNIEDFCGAPTRFRAEVMGSFGHVQSRKSFKEEPDFVNCMAAIKAATGS